MSLTTLGCGSGQVAAIPDIIRINLALALESVTLDALADGAAVATWADTSGNGRNVTGAATEQPLKQTAANGGRSFSVAQYDGINDVLQHGTAATWKFLHDGSDWTAYVVFYVTDASPDTLYGLFGTDSGSNARIGASCLYDDRSSESRSDQLIQEICKGSGGNWIIYNQSADGVWAPQAWGVATFVYDAGVGGDDAVTYVNGISVCSDETANLPYSGSNPTYNLDIGALGNKNRPAKISLAELLIYTEAHDNDERNTNQQALAGLFGL